MAKDSTAAQLYEAVGRKRIASLLLEFFIALFDKQKKYHPDVHDDDPVLWLHFDQQFLADKFHTSKQTIARHVKMLVAMRYVSVHQKGAYDRSYSYEIHRAKIGSIYQEMPLFEGIQESDQAIKMSASKLSKCQHANYQNDSLEAIKMTACSLSNYPMDYPSSSGVKHAEAENHSGREEKTVVLSVQPSERQSADAYDTEKQQVVQQFRECNITQEYAEADIARFGIHLCKAVVAAVQLKKRKGEKVQGQGGGLLKRGLKDPACLGLEMNKQGVWMPAYLIARQQKITSSQPVVHRSPFMWDNLDYRTQCDIRERIDSAHADKPPAVRLQLYKREAELLHNSERP